MKGNTATESGTRIDSVSLIYEGWGRFLLLRMSDRDGTTYTRQVEDHGDAVCVLPYDPVRRVITLVRQLRPAVLHAGGDPMLLEAPAGMLEPDSTPDECARREVIEEAGIHLGALTRIGTVWSGPGFTTERITLYLAIYDAADRRSAGGGLASEHEVIEVVELPLDDAIAMSESGEINDMKTLALLRDLQVRLLKGSLPF